MWIHYRPRIANWQPCGNSPRLWSCWWSQYEVSSREIPWGKPPGRRQDRSVSIIQQITGMRGLLGFPDPLWRTIPWMSSDDTSDPHLSGRSPDSYKYFPSVYKNSFRHFLRLSGHLVTIWSINCVLISVLTSVQMESSRCRLGDWQTDSPLLGKKMIKPDPALMSSLLNFSDEETDSGDDHDHQDTGEQRLRSETGTSPMVESGDRKSSWRKQREYLWRSDNEMKTGPSFLLEIYK